MSGMFMNLFLNSLIYLDIFLTIRNPFYPRDQRAKAYSVLFYLIMTWLFLTGVIILSYNKKVAIDERQVDLLFYQQDIILYFAAPVSFITIISTVLVLIRLLY